MACTLCNTNRITRVIREVSSHGPVSGHFSNHTSAFMFKNKMKMIYTYPCKPQLYYMSRVMRNPAFCKCENKATDHLCGKRRTADQRLCFRYTDSVIPLLPKSEISSLKSSHLLLLYSPVCVGPGRKPLRPVFSQRGSYKSGVRGGLNGIIMLA